MPADDLHLLTEGLRSLAAELGARTQTEHAPLWLTLDQGGHASRAIAFDNAGQQVAQAFAPIATHHPDSDRIEHDPLEIVQSLRTVIDDVADSLGADIDRVQAAGLATQRSSIVCWHAQSGEPLSPVLSWQDRRNTALIAQLQAHRNEIQQLTGLVLSPHYGASKLRWCLDELPAVQAAYRQGQLHCGPLSTYLLQALLLERPHLVDPANASRTQLWSPATGDWSAPLLEWFGVPGVCLPQNVPTLHRYGHLSCGARQIPLLACTGDQAAVPFANGALGLHSIYINLGTGAFALAPLTADRPQAAPLLRSVLYSDAQQMTFALEGTVNGAASALHWLAERSALDVQRAALALRREQVDKLSIPLFINGIGGVGSPYWLPQVAARFIADPHGEAVDDTAQLVAVIESIAFLLAANIDLMRRQLPELTQLVIGGGLSTCSYLCECMADLTHLPVIRLGERELTARGLAYLVAGRPAIWLPDTQTASFTPQQNDSLLARQSRWLQQMKLLQQTAPG
ncbi:MAG: FGGY family carbohydrate kinase [Steroidobacteraceae bacterium]